MHGGGKRPSLKYELSNPNLAPKIFLANVQETKSNQIRPVLGIMLARNALKPLSKGESAMLEMTDLAKIQTELRLNHYTFAGIVNEVAIAYQNNFEDIARSEAGKILLEYFSKNGDTNHIYQVKDLPKEVKEAFKEINRDGTYQHVPEEMPFRLVAQNRLTLLGSQYSGDVRWPKDLQNSVNADAEMIKGAYLEPILPPKKTEAKRITWGTSGFFGLPG